MAEHYDFGRDSEERAVEFLAAKGYRILHRNWRMGRYELDIVAATQTELVVVEVKARSTNFFEEPVNAVTKAKQKRIVAATDVYVNQFNVQLPVRFDVIGIVGKQPGELRHVANAFIPGL